MTESFDSDGVRIAYDDVGSGEPVVLLHGFAADRRLNWRLTGWYELLTKAGYRVIAADARGHGRSDRPPGPEAYEPAGIAGDTVRLLDHLGIERANLFGYSMGGRNAAWLLHRHPDRFMSAIIGGVGINLLRVDDPSVWESRGFKLTADNRKTKSLAIPSLERLYGHATRSGGQIGALAACLLGAFPNMSTAALKRIKSPTLVICGSRDTTAGSPIPLAESIPAAKAVVIPGATHLSSITDPFCKGAVLGFLGQRWERPGPRRRPRRHR